MRVGFLPGLPVLLVCYSTLGSLDSSLARRLSAARTLLGLPVLDFLTIIKVFLDLLIFQTTVAFAYPWRRRLSLTQKSKH